MQAKALKEAQAVVIQQGCAWVGEMEAAMSVAQSTQEAVRVKPVKPRIGSNQGRPMNVPTMPCAASE